MTSKLYIGNLGQSATEDSIKTLFEQNELNATSFLVKKGGYAFVETADQSDSDKAIEKLNGFNFNGQVIVVEPSVPRRTRGQKCKILLKGVPVHAKWEDLERLLATFGTVQRCEQVTGEEGNTVNVTYETSDQAQQAVDQLNSFEYEGSTLKVDFITTRENRDKRTGYRNRFSGMGQNRPNADLPLRLLVPGDMVGAIIGRQGVTIREITQKTRARVDIHRKVVEQENSGSLEKAITIFGSPENCSGAARKIMDVMAEEAKTTGKPEIPLKMLAHNNLIGRVIGKGGNVIKKIMTDTDTKITVSSIHDINGFNMERTITIRGRIEDMCAAENAISAKLRQSFENDMASMSVSEAAHRGPGPASHQASGMDSSVQPQNMMYPGLANMPMMQYGNSFRGNTPPAPYGMFGPQGYFPGLFPGSTPYAMQQKEGMGGEVTFLYIPDAAVGAVIGAKGSHIRNIIRLSGASVKIETNKGKEEGEMREQGEERRVTIMGSPESQWKAQFYIFDKIRQEGFAGNDEVRLRAEIMVPSSMVGRIIGKGGQNVREVQRVTGAIVKLPEETQSQSQEEVPVRIIGHFYANQSAQRRIRALINQQNQVGGGGGGMPRGPRGAPPETKREPSQ